MAKTLEELRKFNKKRKNEYTFDSGGAYIGQGSTVTEAYINRLAQLNENKPVGSTQQASPVRGSAARDLTAEQRQKLQNLANLGGKFTTFKAPTAPYALPTVGNKSDSTVKNTFAGSMTTFGKPTAPYALPKTAGTSGETAVDIKQSFGKGIGERLLEETNNIASRDGAKYDTVAEKGRTADSGYEYSGYDMGNVQNKVRYYENNRQQIIDDLNMNGAINIYERWDYLTEDEKKAYDYMIGSGQYQKAEEFLDGMDRTLQYRQEQQIAKDIEKEEGVNKYISAFAYGTAGGIGDAIGNIMTPVDRLMGKDVTENVNTTAMQETLAESEVKGLRFMNSMGQTLGNMVPSLALGGGLGRGVMFLNSAGSAYREAKETDASELQCVIYALLSGASEVGLQKVLGGIARLGSKGNVGKVVSEAIKKVSSKVSNQKLLTALVGLGNYAGDAAGEALEEYLQSIITPVLQNSFLGADNEITLTSPEQLEAALSGALFSAVFNGISLATGKLSYTDENASAPASADNNSENTEGTVDTSGKLPASEVSSADTSSANTPEFKMIPYNDKITQSMLTRDKHLEMLENNKYIELNKSDIDALSEYYPDLKTMKSEDRKPILKSLNTKLKETIRNILSPLAGQSFRFEVNNGYIDATLYTKGINHVLKNLKAEKAAALMKTQEIFSKAEYLYDTPTDTENYGHSKSDVKQWHYFYVPIKSDIDTGIKGIRIAVRDVLRVNENQIWDWGIKKESSLDGVVQPHSGNNHGVSSEDSLKKQTLDGVVWPKNGDSHGVSSASFNNNISQPTALDNTLPENSAENISTNAVPALKTHQTAQATDSIQQSQPSASAPQEASSNTQEVRAVTPFTAKDYTNAEAHRRYTDGFIEKLSKTLDVPKERLLDKKGSMITSLVEELESVENFSDDERLSLANKFIEGVGFSSDKQHERAVKTIYEDMGTLHRQIKNYSNAVSREAGRIKKRTAAGSLSIDEMDKLYKERSSADRELKSIQRKNPLTSDGKAVLKDILAGRRSIESIEGLAEGLEIRANYDAEIKLREKKQQIQDYNISRKAKRYAKAAVLTESSNTWKDKKLGLSYSTETLERNFEDICKNHELAKSLEREYVTPIKRANAEITRRTNEIAGKIEKLKISKKQTYKFDNFYQHLVDFYFENGTAETKDVYAKQVAEYYGVKNLSELGSRNLSEAELVQLYGEGIISEADIERIGADTEKIKNCTVTFKEIYNQLFTEVNRAYISNGYEPMNYIENYFPHYRKETATNWLKKYVRETIGFDGNFNAEWNNLSTDIAGTTDTFKPGRKYFAHALHREGDITSYDCLEGMQSYLDTALQIIYQTDNIQNLRALEGQLRYKYSDEGVKARLAEINNNTELDEAQRQKELEGVYMESDSQLSNFVQELRRYTNRLAGKKSDDDRPFEYLLNRPMYKVMNKLTGNVAGNMIGLSFGSALTNLTPLTLATGEINTEYLLRGINDSAKNKVQTDNLMARSDFYTARKGAEQITVSAAQKISNALSKPAEFTDLFTVEAVFRGKYYQNMARGFTDAEAIADADRYCSQLFADRNKNVMPTMWHATNPFTKLATMFQLEVNNQWRYVFKDMPRNLDKNKGAFAWSLVQILIASWLANKAKEELTGYGGLWDPVGLVEDTINDFADKDTSLGQDLYNLGNNVLDQLPFVSAFTGGGRIPVLSILPEGEDAPATLDAIQALISGNGNAKQVQEIITNVVVPSAYVLNPLGGAGQLKKTAQGIATVIRGGEIGYNAKGEPYYKYVVDNDTPGSTFWNYAQAGVFGKSALSEAQDYYDGSTEKLSPEQTAALQRLKEIGAGTYKVSQVMQTVNQTDASRDAQGNIIDSRAENVINYVKDTSLDETEKEEVIFSSDILSDETIAEVNTAEEEYEIPAMVFYEAYLARIEAESEKDVFGNTVTNSKSAYIRKAIDDIGGLSDIQRAYLYEVNGVNKTVANASDFDLQMIYENMSRQKEEAERRKSVGFTS